MKFIVSKNRYLSVAVLIAATIVPITAIGPLV